MKKEQFLGMLTLCLLTACSANPTAAPDKASASAQASAIVARPSGNSAASTQAAYTKSRFVFVLLDSSKSYPLYDAAIRKVCAIANGLGAGDQLVVARLGERFRPETNIKLQARMPEIPGDLLVAGSRLVEWRQKQASVNAIWQQIEKRRLDISSYLSDHLRGKNTADVTDLWGALDYCAHRLPAESAMDKYLVVFSDLEHDFEKHKSSQPPARSIELQGIRARLLYIPWTRNWVELQRDWGIWFTRAGVADFLILDSGESAQALIVTPAQKPELQSPFGKK